MKKLALIIVLVAPLLAFAADPVVTVTSFSNVSVDGAPAGTVVDVLANVNKPNIRARLFDALIAYEAKLIADATAAANTVIAPAIAAKTAAEQSQAAAVAARQAAETAKTTAEAKRDAIIASLKGVAPTLLPANVRAELLDAREKERAALLARKAAIDAEVAAIP